MIALLALAAALAAEPPPKCDDPQTQIEMTLCAGEDARVADLTLNKQWAVTSAIMKRMDKEDAPRDGQPGYYASLLEAQRAWIKYRDLQCRTESYAMRGGSAQPMVHSGCIARLTNERVRQLKDIDAAYRGT